MIYYQFKNCVERILALIILITTSPVIFLILLINCIILKSNPIFSQKRVGRNNKIFMLYKIKTLKDSKQLFIVTNKREYFFGNFIRKYSIDEVLQLINIVKGEMAFIGPRPLLVEYLNSDFFYNHCRALVKPGITGLAQVIGRNTLPFSKVFAYDKFYVNHQSLKLDFFIFRGTVRTILKNKKQFGEATVIDDLNLSKYLSN